MEVKSSFYAIIPHTRLLSNRLSYTKAIGMGSTQSGKLKTRECGNDSAKLDKQDLGSSSPFLFPQFVQSTNQILINEKIFRSHKLQNIKFTRLQVDLFLFILLFFSVAALKLQDGTMSTRIVSCPPRTKKNKQSWFSVFFFVF